MINYHHHHHHHHHHKQQNSNNINSNKNKNSNNNETTRLGGGRVVKGIVFVCKQATDGYCWLLMGCAWLIKKVCVVTNGGVMTSNYVTISDD